MSFICDLCISSVVDAINVQIKFLKCFKEDYFGYDGIKNVDMLKETMDYKWMGLSIDLIMDKMKKLKYDKVEIKRQMLKNEEYIQNGKEMFVDLCNEYRENSMDPNWSALFSAGIWTSFKHLFH